MTTPTLQEPALTEVLAELHGRFGLERWIVTRCEGAELIVVASHGDGLDIEAGARFPSETIVARTISRDGPRAAPDLAGVPAYADAPVAVQLGLRAYLGAPIRSGDRVLGTLAGLDREPQGAGLVDAVPFVELCAGLLGPSVGRRARCPHRSPDRAMEPPRLGRGRHERGGALPALRPRRRRPRHRPRPLQGDQRPRRPPGGGRAPASRGRGDRRKRSRARQRGPLGRGRVLRARGRVDELAAGRLRARVREALAAAAIPASLGLALRGREGLREAVARALAGTAEEKRSDVEWVVDHV